MDPKGFHRSILLLLVTITGVLSASLNNNYLKHQNVDEKEIYPFLATRTAYEFVHGNITRPDHGSCRPIQMWGLVRHGTRYPSGDVIAKMLDLVNVRDRIIKNHESGAGSLSWETLQNLRLWQPDPNMNGDMEQVLAPQGYRDLSHLAKRLQKAYPELLKPKVVDPKDYIFRSTDTQRTQASMQAFMFGLFNDSKAVTPAKIPKPDTLFLPHKHCPAWKAETKHGHINTERDKFAAGPEMKRACENISARLGFRESLKLELLKPMYEMCRFETAWHVKEGSIWCSLFSQEDLEVFEYYEDVNYYNYIGPGREMSVKLGCPTLSDMFQHFRELNEDDSAEHPKAEFSFAHTLTLQSLLTALGIGKQSKGLKATDFNTAKNRTYRISLLDPFATNVVSVFYRCDGNETSNKVAMFIAEKLITIPGCDDVMCDWEQLEDQYGSAVDDCNLTFCYKKSQY